MSWRIMLQGDDGQEYTSSSLASRENALSFACDLVRNGDLRILEIVDDRGEKIDLDEVMLVAEAAKLERVGRSRA